MIANAYNTSILEELQQSPYFDKAAQLLHEDLAYDLSKYGSAKSSGQTNVQNTFVDFPGVFHDTQNQQLAVYVEEPSILNRLSKYIKILEVTENISLPGYEGKKKISNIFLPLRGQGSIIGNAPFLFPCKNYR